MKFLMIPIIRLKRMKVKMLNIPIFYFLTSCIIKNCFNFEVFLLLNI